MRLNHYTFHKTANMIHYSIFVSNQSPREATFELTPKDDHFPIWVLGQTLVAGFRGESNGHTKAAKKEANALATCILHRVTTSGHWFHQLT